MCLRCAESGASQTALVTSTQFDKVNSSKPKRALHIWFELSALYTAPSGKLYPAPPPPKKKSCLCRNPTQPTDRRIAAAGAQHPFTQVCDVGSLWPARAPLSSASLQVVCQPLSDDWRSVGAEQTGLQSTHTERRCMQLCAAPGHVGQSGAAICCSVNRRTAQSATERCYRTQCPGLKSTRCRARRRPDA